MMMMKNSLLKWKNKKFADAEVRRSLCLLEREKEGEVNKASPNLLPLLVFQLKKSTPPLLRLLTNNDNRELHLKLKALCKSGWRGHATTAGGVDVCI